MGELEEMSLIPREQWRGNGKVPASPCLALAPLPVLIRQLGEVRDDATGSQDLLFLSNLNLERLGPKLCSKGK